MIDEDGGKWTLCAYADMIRFETSLVAPGDVAEVAGRYLDSWVELRGYMWIPTT